MKKKSKTAIYYSYDRHPVKVRKALKVLLDNNWSYIGTGMVKITFDGVDAVRPKRG